MSVNADKLHFRWWRNVTMCLSVWCATHRTLKWYVKGNSFLFEIVLTTHSGNNHTKFNIQNQTKLSPFSVLSPCSDIWAVAQLQSSSPEASIQWLQQGKCLLTWELDPMSQLRPRGSLPLSLLAAQMTCRVPVCYHSVLIGMFKPPQIKTMIYVSIDLSKTALRMSHGILSELQHCYTVCARIQMRYSYARCVCQCLLI